MTFIHCISYSQTNGLRIKTYDDATGIVSNVVYQNISIHHVRNEWIVINEFYSNSKRSLENNNLNRDSLIVVQNITFNDIFAYGVKEFTHGGQLICLEESPCLNLSFNNVKIDDPLSNNWNCSNAFGSQSQTDPRILCLQNSNQISHFDPLWEGTFPPLWFVDLNLKWDY